MKLTAARILVAASALALTAAAHADTYDFTGTKLIGGPYAGDTLTGSFTLASPLSASTNYANIDPTAFSFTVDGQTITNLSPGVNSAFTYFNAAPNGNINEWSIVVKDPTLSLDLTNNGEQVGTSWNLLGGSITKAPSTAIPAAVTPEPSSILLMGTGMLAIAFMMRKKMLPA